MNDDFFLFLGNLTSLFQQNILFNVPVKLKLYYV
jgi:hypothetical protein